MGTGALVGVSLLVVAAIGAAVGMSLWRRSRIQQIQTILNMLRASEPEIRVRALEEIADLSPSSRRLVAGEVARAVAGGAGLRDQKAGSRVAYWYLRQLFALLADSRSNVRADASRLLQTVLRQMSHRPQAPQEEPEQAQAQPLSKPAAVLVEMGASRALARSAADPGLKVMAFAELLEAGLLRPAPGQQPQPLEAVVSEAMEPISNASQDMNVGVRRGVVDVLEASGSEDAARMLGAMLYDPAADVRAQAAQALGRLKAVSAVPSLTEALRDPVVDVQAGSAWALAEIGARAACPAILDALIERCEKEPIAAQDDGRIQAIVESAARLAEATPAAVARALQALPQPVGDSLARALEANGIVAGWCGIAWAPDKGSQSLRDLLAHLAARGITRPFHEALESPDPLVRAGAAQVLGQCKDNRALDALLNLTSDADASVRISAISALGSIALPRSAEQLASCINDPDWRVREAAVNALAAVAAAAAAWQRGASPFSRETLDSAVQTASRALLAAAADLDEQVRASVARALGLLDKQTVGDVLVRMALHDSSESVRQAARVSLRQVRPTHTVSTVMTAAADPDPVLRAQALYILAILDGPNVAWRIIEGLDDNSAVVREAAVRCVAELDWRPAAARLLYHLRSPDATVRAGVLRALAQPAGAAYLDRVAERLSDPDEQVRASAVDTLAAHAEHAYPYRQAVAERLRDPSEAVRQRAAAATAKLGEPVQVERVLAALRDSEQAVRTQATARLVDMAVSGALDPLADALDDAGCREAIVTALTGAASSAARLLVQPLLRAGRGHKVKIITALADVLEQAGALEAWLADLSDVDPQTRAAAVEAIGLLGSRKAMGGLMTALQKDPSAEIRMEAARVLADFGGDEVYAALVRAQQDDPDPNVRQLAANLARTLSQRSRPLPE